jgi:hypothetical protein
MERIGLVQHSGCHSAGNEQEQFIGSHLHPALCVYQFIRNAEAPAACAASETLHRP